MHAPDQRQLRVFIGTQEIAGFYGRLHAGLIALGVDSVFVDFSAHPFKYGTAPMPMPWFVRACVWLGKRRSATPRSRRLAKVLLTGLHLVSCLPLLAWAAYRFDAFIFAFGQSIFGINEAPLLELPLLRRLGKRIVVVFNGSDSRPPYMDGSLMALDRGRTIEDCIRLTRDTKRRVARAERYADAIVVHGPHAQFFTRPFAQTLLVGVAAPTIDLEPPRERRPGPVRALHAPSHPEAKGTALIRTAVEELRAEGVELDYREITGRPNREVLDAIVDSDFVIDQVWSDIPLGVFAEEAAVLGRPAVVGGYAWPELRRTIGDDAIPPAELCEPDEIKASIRRLATDDAYRSGLGERARAFVLQRWAAAAVAERYLRIIEARSVPADLAGDPGEVQYVNGMCLSEERCRWVVGQVLLEGGPSALQLDAAPDLRGRLVSLAHLPGERAP